MSGLIAFVARHVDRLRLRRLALSSVVAADRNDALPESQLRRSIGVTRSAGIPTGAVILQFVAVAMTASLVFLVPFDLGFARILLAAWPGHARISMVGNSVMAHFSKCDSDRRGVPAMVGDELGEPVLNLSFGGQQLVESTNFAATSLRNPHIQTVILPLSVFALNAWDAEPLRSYVAFRLINPELSAEPLAARLAAPDWFTRNLDPSNQPFVFQGVRYPDHNGIADQFLTREQALMPCPEGDGYDMQFITANYWHSYIGESLLPQNFTLLASLGRLAARTGKSLQVVVLPIDYPFLQRLLPDQVATVRGRVAALMDSLRARGLAVTDLSDAMGADAFVDRWCACGHLGQAGRLAVARRIAGIINPGTVSVAARPLPTSPPPSISP